MRVLNYGFTLNCSEKCELFVTKNKVVEVNPQVKAKEILFYECMTQRNIFLANFYSTLCFCFVLAFFHFCFIATAFKDPL